MSSVRQIISNNTGTSVASGASGWFPPNTGQISSKTSDTIARVTYRTAGTISNLTCRLIAGDRTADHVIILKNNAASGLDIAYTSTPGEFEDTTHTASIAALDTVSIKATSGAGGTTNFSFTYFGFIWAATNNTTQHLGNNGAAGFVSTGTSFLSPAGPGNPTSTQANGEWLVKLPLNVDHVTLKNLYVRVSSNTSTNAIAVSINGASGSGTAPNVSIAGSSGAVTSEDSSNSIQVKNGDKISFKIVTGAGTVSIFFDSITIEMQSDNNVSFFIASNPNGIALTNTKFHVAGGISATSATEGNVQSKFGLLENQILSFLSVYVSTNGTASSVTLRDAAASVGTPGNVSVATTGGIGWITDSTNKYKPASTSELAFLAAGTVHAVTCVALTCQTFPIGKALNINQAPNRGSTY